jgi:hypothetical protein
MIFARPRIPRSIVRERINDASSAEQWDAGQAPTTDAADSSPQTIDLDVEQGNAEQAAEEAVARWQSAAVTARAAREERVWLAEKEAAQAEGITWRIVYREGDVCDLLNEGNTPKFGVRISGGGVLRPKIVERIDPRSGTSFHAYGASDQVVVAWHRREDQSDRPRQWTAHRPPS